MMQTKSHEDYESERYAQWRSETIAAEEALRGQRWDEELGEFADVEDED